MAEFPAFPLWTDAYLADTAHLSNLEHGVYLRVLILMWRQPGQRIPKDAEWIARHLAFTAGDAEAFGRVAAEFLTSSGGWWVQKRLASEWTAVSQLTEIRSLAGRAGGRKSAEARRAKILEKLRSEASKPTDLPEANEQQNGSKSQPPTPTPTPTPSVKNTPIVPKGTADTPEFLTFWEAYPHKVGKPAARTKFAIALRKADLETILAGLERYKRAKPPDREWCHPTTWLSQERWNDQPAPLNGATGKPNGHAQPKRWTPPAYGSEEWKRDQRRMGLLNDGE